MLGQDHLPTYVHLGGLLHLQQFPVPGKFCEKQERFQNLLRQAKEKSYLHCSLSSNLIDPIGSTIYTIVPVPDHLLILDE